MGFFGWGSGPDVYLVVATHEGAAGMRLNGNRLCGTRHAARNAAAHPQTVCWAVLGRAGTIRSGGLGPAAGRLGPGQAQGLLDALPGTMACRDIVRAMTEGRRRAAAPLAWGLRRVAGFGRIATQATPAGPTRRIVKVE